MLFVTSDSSVLLSLVFPLIELTLMKITYIYLTFVAILCYTSFLSQRDHQLLKAYDACLKYTHHPDCPNSWKTKPAFAHR